MDSPESHSKQLVDRRTVRITVFMKGNALLKRLEIPGRDPVENDARPPNLCEEGDEYYDDLEQNYRCGPDETVIIFNGTQFEWEENIVSRALGSRGQTIHWEKRLNHNHQKA